MRLKFQVSVLSIVIISGIIIALVGTAYMWGAPLISKRETVTYFTAATGFMEELNGRITEMANTGAGEYTLDIPVGGINVIPNTYIGENNNSIILEFFSSQPMVLGSGVVYLGDSLSDVLNETGIYGVSRPSVTTLTGEPFGSGYLLIIKMHYRELDSGTRGYKIVLNQNRETKSGNDKITISFDGTQTIPGGAVNNGDLILNQINIEVA